MKYRKGYAVVCPNLSTNYVIITKLNTLLYKRSLNERPTYKIRDLVESKPRVCSLWVFIF